MTNTNNLKDPTNEEMMQRFGVYSIILGSTVYIGTCRCSFADEYMDILDSQRDNPYHLLCLGAEFSPVVAMENGNEELLWKYKEAVETIYKDEELHANYTLVH